MRVVVVGAGSVGRSIARELIYNEHQVLLIDKYAEESRTRSVPEASWLLADACEITTLQEAGLSEADVVVCATGDDKVNLVVSLLAKTEFGVARTVARVSNPKNEWMFDEAWGVDVAVSTPRLMTALVEEAVSIGDLVRLFEFQQGKATMVEVTLPSTSPYVGRRVADLNLPPECVLVGIIREEKPIAPTDDDAIEALDELLFLATPAAELELATSLTGRDPQEIRIRRED
ncbi:TrkA family potassium uptake protein [Luteipulveratus sp. YIM 133132]|uniref:Trk system potassium uptake protein TrkA n=1 Tax=Luteipulveratus flavus TaxID=3031728 RepID=A0ABT6CAL5_9MICO|nr:MULTISPECIES: TrkA family potassium uptake protein [unclassified Luteipulveratus]MDE9366808.1 TrkA family potassium uptake protein [Luteipulveratus sp. YIM 133132]MDF8265840.1 TrkA family potassium uptake protein [Luteipulveratus sp. YIM 133296]